MNVLEELRREHQRNKFYDFLIGDLASTIGVNRATVYRWLKKGRITNAALEDRVKEWIISKKAAHFA